MRGLVGSSAAENQQWWPVRNDSGEEVPAFACMRITGMFAPFTVSGESNLRVGVANMGFTVSKPNTFASQYSHMFNGPVAIAAGAVGQGAYGQVMLARYAFVGSTPAAGSNLGPINNSWELHGGSYGFTAIDATLNDTLNSSGYGLTVVRVVQSPALFLRGTAAATLGTGLVNVDTGLYQVTATYHGTPSLSSGDQVYLHWNQGTWRAAKP